MSLFHTYIETHLDFISESYYGMKKLVLFCVFVSGFADYMVSGGELAYQQLCSEITQEFNDCSKQVCPPYYDS